MDATAVIVALARIVSVRIVTVKKRNKSLLQTMMKMITVNRVGRSAI